MSVPVNSDLLPLKPFGQEGPPAVALGASAQLVVNARGERQLRLHYRLQGCSALRLPAPAPEPQRRDELWQHTCLEAFLAPAGSAAYWEVNLAPSGDWNVYRLSAYRQGLQPDAGYPALPLRSSLDHDSLVMELCCPLPPTLAAAAALELGLCAVLEDRNGAISYWALHHPGAAADFHDRRGWTLQL